MIKLLSASESVLARPDAGLHHLVLHVLWHFEEAIIFVEVVQRHLSKL